MDPDDLEPRRQKPAQKNLDEMSIEALEDYLAELAAEMDRVRNAIAAKQRARDGAHGLFKL